MGEQDLLEAIRRTYAGLPKAERMKIIKELCEKAGNDAFIAKFYPEFYAEVYPPKREQAQATTCGKP
jgi:hypothetical protein